MSIEPVNKDKTIIFRKGLMDEVEKALRDGLKIEDVVAEFIRVVPTIIMPAVQSGKEFLVAKLLEESFAIAVRNAVAAWIEFSNEQKNRGDEQ